MSTYELIYILDVSLEETVRKEQIDKFSALITANGGTIEKFDEWGKRRLAYPIDFKNEGYYVLINFSAGPDLPREIERNLQISDSVLRYLIVKLEQKTTSVKPRAVRAYAAPVAPAAVEAPAAQAGNAPAAPVQAPVVDVQAAPAQAEEAAPTEANDGESAQA